MHGNYLSKILKCLMLFSVVYWIGLYYFQPDSRYLYDVFGLLLTILPLLGGIYGLNAQKEWGGMESFVGKSLIFISLSLFAWSFGQFTYFIYSFSEEIPYPGLPDYFFILMDPFYALALLSVMRYSGAVKNFKSSISYLFSLIVPLVSLYINYVIFFGDTSYFEVIDTAVIFDLIYSFGSIALMSLTILTVAMSINKLGGKMRTAIYLLFVGFVIQYIGDVSFSILESQDLSYNGNLSDFIYFVSITCVVLGITQFNTKRFDNNQTGGNDE